LSFEFKIDSAALQEGWESDHPLDAMICVVVGFDFLDGKCLKPDNQSNVQREGWIWVRDPHAVAK